MDAVLRYLRSVDMVSEWTFEFEAPIGTRIHHHFMCVTTFSDLWWDYREKKFRNYFDIEGEACSASPPIRTLKAFKRFLKKHPELKGCEVILVSRYIGHNVTARFIEKKEN